MATFISDSTLREVLNSANQHAASPLPAHWETLIPMANQRAYAKLRAIILGRGFTAAQFASWGSATDSDGVDWNKRLGVLYAMLEAAKTDPDATRIFREELKELLEELATLPLITDGALVADNRITTGEFDTSEDRFTLDEPDGSGDFSVGDGTTL